MGIKSLGNSSIKYTAVWEKTGTGAMKPSSPDIPLAWCGDRGVWMGGYAITNVIDYIAINSPGDATDFGDLTAPRFGGGAVSNGSRACYGGGLTTGEAASNIIDYITIATTGDATDFGDVSAGRSAMTGLSNATRGIFAGGYESGYFDTIEYITIASTGDATDFGNLGTGMQGPAGCSSRDDRGLFCGGHSASAATNVIEYITITTTSDASDFGDLINNIYFAAAAASFSRAVVAGGYNVNVIQYFATGTLGNAVDFGDLSGTRYALGACTNGAGYGADRAVFGGGYDGGSALNTIEYVAVSTTGNATDFGDLTVARRYPAGCSGD